MSKDDAMQNIVSSQYRDSRNLDARIRLHQLFSTNTTGWYPWYLKQLDLPPQCDILELGCGPGSMWKTNLTQLPQGWQLTLTDFSQGMVKQAHQNLPDQRFRYTVADAQSIPFPAQCFDAVIANHMLYHVPDVRQALSEIRRVLRPGGKFYAATNGLKHMAEMNMLVERLTPDLFERNELSAPGTWTRNFSLENGGEQITEYFSQVTLNRYEDGLIVTEAQPLVDYVLSMLGHFQTRLPREKITEFTRQLAAEIEDHGAIRITKATGLFKAEN